jgi:hypothetical protein
MAVLFKTCYAFIYSDTVIYADVVIRMRFKAGVGEPYHRDRELRDVAEHIKRGHAYYSVYRFTCFEISAQLDYPLGGKASASHDHYTVHVGNVVIEHLY